MKTIIYISVLILCIGLISCGGSNKFSSDYNEIYYSAKNKDNQNGQNNSSKNSTTNTGVNSNVKTTQNSNGNDEKVVLNPYSRTNASSESNKQSGIYNQLSDTNQLAGEIDDQVIYPGDDNDESEKTSNPRDGYESKDKVIDSQKDDEVSFIDSLGKFQDSEFSINLNKSGYIGLNKIRVPFFSISLSYRNYYNPGQNNISESEYANNNQGTENIPNNKSDISIRINERIADKVNHITRLTTDKVNNILNIINEK